MSQALDGRPSTDSKGRNQVRTDRPAIRRSGWLPISVAWTLFLMSLARLTRPQRMLALLLPYLLLLGLVGGIRYWRLDLQRNPEAHSGLEVMILLNLLPYTLIPLSALLTAPGLIQDEVEEQTLTYLLVRPLPRWLIYLAKLLATIVVTAILAAIFTVAAETLIWWGHEDFRGIVPEHSAKLSALLALSLIAYNAVFGALGLFVRRPLGIGVIYMIVLEGLLANIDFVFRRGTVMYYFRVLVLRWLEPTTDPGWSIDLEAAPSAQISLATLLIASLLLALFSAWFFSIREFRLKTPEAS